MMCLCSNMWNMLRIFRVFVIYILYDWRENGSWLHGDHVRLFCAAVGMSAKPSRYVFRHVYRHPTSYKLIWPTRRVPQEKWRHRTERIWILFFTRVELMRTSRKALYGRARVRWPTRTQYVRCAYEYIIRENHWETQIDSRTLSSQQIKSILLHSVNLCRCCCGWSILWSLQLEHAPNLLHTYPISSYILQCDCNV